jgi:branched-chain amino acid transport system substrate-binding protein
MCRLATVAIVTLLAALGGPARSDILIGVASPMTGPQSWGGEQFERAAEMAVADLNAKGGVLGHSVELIIGDDFCDPDQAVALVRRAEGKLVMTVTSVE